MFKDYYVKYNNHLPVAVKTHILNTKSFEWIQTLFTVGDLIAACTLGSTRRLLGLPEDHGPLTLHSSVDGPIIQGNTPLSSMHQPSDPYNQPFIIKLNLPKQMSMQGIGFIT